MTDYIIQFQHFLGPMTHHSLLGPMTHQSFLGPMTQYCFHKYMTQPSMSQHLFVNQCYGNDTDSINCISDSAAAFVYQSQYIITTPEYAILRSCSPLECENIKFSKKRGTLMFVHNQIKFVSCPILSAHAPNFIRGIGVQLWHNLKQKIMFDYYNWNINCRIFVFISSSHDVELLIAHILMKLQRYITRRHDFAFYWRSLMICGLFKSQHMLEL